MKNKLKLKFTFLIATTPLYNNVFIIKIDERFHASLSSQERTQF